MTISNKVDPHFIYSIRIAIEMMRENGINDIRIACIITEIRSAAVSEERRRFEQWIREYPPIHHLHVAILDAMKG